jgi:tetratricopeptide (TPR) repeat protein
LAAYDEAIELNKKFATAYYNRGLLKLRLELYKEAIDDFSHALAHNPDRLDAYLRRGTIFMDVLNDIPEAIHNFNEAIRRDRNISAGYYLRGSAFMEAGDYQQAIYDLNTALDIDPQNAIFYWERARARRKLEDFEAAIADCTTALRLNIDLAPAYKTRAMLYARQGKLTKAIADFERCLERDQFEKNKIKKYIAALNKAIRKKKRETSGRGPAAEAKKEAKGLS